MKIWPIPHATSTRYCFNRQGRCTREVYLFELQSSSLPIGIEENRRSRCAGSTNYTCHKLGRTEGTIYTKSYYSNNINCDVVLGNDAELRGQMTTKYTEARHGADNRRKSAKELSGHVTT